jgi:NADH:ubiquinone oxidoreductase subunit
MSIGTKLHTLLHGQKVGQDASGNIYYQTRKLPPQGERRRRWVIYAGAIDASVVPSEWHAWLHYTTDTPLAETQRKPWQKPHQPNLTGTISRYHPGAKAAAAGSEYEAWTPDADVAATKG